MKLFFSILPDQNAKQYFMNQIDELHQKSIQGTFTRVENLHLTLQYIGETSKLEEVTQVLESIDSEPFFLRLGKRGRFARTDGDIYWIGTMSNSTLESLHKQVQEKLNEKQFLLENRVFCPHFTLGHRVILEERYQWVGQAEDLVIPVSSIYMMKSDQSAFGVRYTIMAKKELS